ncbi:hypothetical protein [Thalassoglobus sp.]|uniref:hypothetical protein n=1 Tax=Thalassoglobus sp. TaxID=2795869 RepID=UPI003AA873C0
MNSSTYNSVFDDCFHSILSAVESANVSNRPFPHFLFQNILPESVYFRLLETFPPIENYSELGKYAGTEGQTRYRCSLTQEGLQGMDSESQAIWKAVRDALGHPTVKATVFRQLSEGLTYRYSVPREEVENVTAYPKTEIYHEKSGYSIKPHPDTRKKVVTMQIALPTDDSQSHLGTEFYRLSPLGLLSKPVGFTKVMTTPFQPNSGYAFVVLNTKFKRSWHGRSELEENSGERNSLLHLYYGDVENGDHEVYEKFYSPTPQLKAAA